MERDASVRHGSDGAWINHPYLQFRFAGFDLPQVLVYALSAFAREQIQRGHGQRCDEDFIKRLAKGPISLRFLQKYVQQRGIVNVFLDLLPNLVPNDEWRLIISTHQP